MKLPCGSTPLAALVLAACVAHGGSVRGGSRRTAPRTWRWTVIELESGVEASLRGLSVVDEQVVWCGGDAGTLLRTTDGGASWLPRPVPGAEDLDFRSVWALDSRRAWVASAGPGAASRIYHTGDGGESWILQHTNEEPQGFFDAIAFWPESGGQRGLVLGDPVGGRLTILRTEDGGAHWERIPADTRPEALPGEYAFAASGTSIALVPPSTAWIVTGGSSSRLLVSADGGLSWRARPLPLGDGSAGAGAFSVATLDGRRGLVVGGDYTQPELAARHFARTADRGRTWDGGRTWDEGRARGEGRTRQSQAEVERGPAGYRSCVAAVPGSDSWIAVGTSGADITQDGGHTWSSLGKEALNSVGLAPSGRVGFAVGPAGVVRRLEPSQ